jgi:uncharacterized protein
MQRWAARLATIGTVSVFDYPYMKELRKRPDPLPKLVAAHREALLRVRQLYDGLDVLIGKSMGGRVGCHLALEEDVAAVICLGYPLCGGGDPARLRADVLHRLTTPILFVQGTRDRLCPLDLIEQTRREMKAPNEMYVVQGGDHSLQVEKARLKATGETQDDVDRRIKSAIESFLATNCAQYLASRSV